MAENGKKAAISSLNIDPFFTFFVHCGHIYNPNGVFWGSTSRPQIRDLVVMSLFSLWGPSFKTWDGPKLVYFGTKMAKHSRLVNDQKWSKRVQEAP